MAIRFVLALLIISATGFYARNLSAARVSSDRIPDLSQVPAVVGGWQSRDYTMTPEVEEVLAADAYLFREYVDATGASVSLFVAYFKDQEVGSQIHSPRNCLPGAGWRTTSIDPVSLTLGGEACPAQSMWIQKRDQRQEVLYWFKTRSGTVTGEYALKWDLVKNSLKRQPTDAAFVRFIAAERNQEQMRSLIALLDPTISGALNQVGLP